MSTVVHTRSCQIPESPGSHVHPPNVPLDGGVRDSRAAHEGLPQVAIPPSRWVGSLATLTPGGFIPTTFDDFVDELLTKDRVCDIILPRLTRRDVLEETEGLAPRKSLLDDEPEKTRSRSSSPDLRGRSRSRSSSRGRSLRSRSNSSSDRSRYVSRSPSRSDSEDEGEVGDTRRYVSRSPSLSPDRAALMNGEKIEGDV